MADFLKRSPVYHFAVQGRRLLAVTSAGGANRVFDLTAIVSTSALFLRAYWFGWYAQFPGTELLGAPQ